MDKYLLARDIILKSGVEVCLDWKTIYLGKGTYGGKSKIKSTTCGDKRDPPSTEIHHTLKKYGILETGFPGGQNMRPFPVKNKTKTDHINKKLMKSALHQKPFLEVIQSDTNA